MPFLAGDRERIWRCLNLSRDQIKDGSRLAVLMTEIERFDTANGTTMVATVRENLDLWEEATEALPALQANDAYQIIDIDREVRLTTHGPGAASAATQGRRAGYVATILKILDERDQLQPFILTGRVFRTL